MSEHPSARPESHDTRTGLLDLVADLADRGERELPSLRELAQKFGVAPNTIKKILLEMDGPLQVVPVHGRGFFLRLPGDPEIAADTTESVNEDEFDPIARERTVPDSGYSPVPEEGRALRKESGSQHDTVLVVGQLLRAIDPTGAPGARFQLFLQMRQTLQHMGFTLAWAPLSYTQNGALDPIERQGFELQVAGLGDRLAGILLIDPGYGREEPIWEIAAQTTNMPIVWFHSAPLDPRLQPPMPSHCHILEPEWDEVGRAMGHWLLENHQPQKLLLLPPPGERHIPAHLEALRSVLLEGWGSRWVMSLDWFDVFPEGMPMHPARSIAGRIHRALLNTGLSRFELDRFFRVARNLRASLWLCSDDLLALAAIDHFEALRLPNEPRPGIIGFGNHPFSLARDLCTVDFSWPSFIERGVELLSGYGRRSRVPRYTVIPAPSHTVYGGSILARNEDWW